MSVMWSYCTTVRTHMGEMPFSLAFGAEAIIPAEIGMTTHKTKNYNSGKNEEGFRNNLDLLEEKRDETALRVTTYKQKMAKYYNSWVKAKRFAVGDLVLRKVTLATQDSTKGKLKPNWEGPYPVTQCKRPGAYHLETMQGEPLPRPWNVEHLRKYYQ